MTHSNRCERDPCTPFSRIPTRPLRTLLGLTFATLLVACQTPTTTRSDADDDGVAVAAHPDAAAAGALILEQGGNAVDAAVAMGFAIAVVEPSMNSIGGRSQLILRLPNGAIRTYNAMTQIPGDYSPPAEQAENGYAVIATPGVVAGLSRIHAESGSLPWGTLLAPAIRLAEDGYVMLPGAAARHAAGLPAIRDDPGFQQSFLKDDGSSYAAGERFRQPALARTLRQIAEKGADDFYEGDIARRIAQDMAAHGGYVTEADLAAYEAIPGRRVQTRYRGYDIQSMAAPGGGGLVVKTLNILENFDLASMNDATWAIVVNQALAIAFSTLLSDYEENDIDLVESRRWAADAARTIRVPVVDVPSQQPVAPAQTALAMHDWDGSGWGEGDDSGTAHHTTHFVAADCSGTVVSITQTLGPLFGSKVITPDLGFPYASTMGAYLSAAQQAPGQRPRTTIAPTLVLRDGEVVMALGAAGGIRILSGIVQTISRVIDRGMDLDAAVAAPRIHPVRTRDPQTDERQFDGLQLHAETTPDQGWSAATLDAWAQAGFTAEPNDRYGAFSRVHALQRRDGRWLGVADPDWEGLAVTPGSSRCDSP